ncbi:MAG: nitroreductase family protein [Clostridium sp.]|nr:nitroreductase family protein [Clostridium sp.]
MIKAIEERRSIRKYKHKDVEEDKLKEILESGRISPSGSNTQPWNFIVIKSDNIRKKVACVCHDQKWMLQAPVFIVCVADIVSRIEDEQITIDEASSENEVKLIIRDTSLAIENMLLQATESGLGTCCVAWFTQKEIRPVLNIPEDKYVVAVITVGYKDEDPKMRPRKKIQEIIHYEQW